MNLDFLNDLLKEKSIKIAEKLIDKRETEKGIHSKSFGRPFSSAPYTGNRPKSGFSMKSYKSKYSGLQNFKM